MNKQALCWIFFIVASRIIPHAPNLTPIVSLSVLSGAYFDKKNSWVIVIIAMLISDFLLSVMNGFNVFGTWTFFTYSALLITTTYSKYFFKNDKKNTNLMPFVTVGGASIFFWLWTNFGCWLTTTIYSHNIHGLVVCYLSAIPFLRNALIGSFVWSFVIFVFTVTQFKNNVKVPVG